MLVLLTLLCLSILRFDVIAENLAVNEHNQTDIHLHYSPEPSVPSTIEPLHQTHGVVRYQHMINNSPNSNYVVYYTDSNAYGQSSQQYRSMPHSERLSRMITHSSQPISVQLLSLVQPTVSNDYSLNEFGNEVIDVTKTQRLLSDTQNLVRSEDSVDINYAQENATHRSQGTIRQYSKSEDSVLNGSEHTVNKAVLASFNAPIVVTDNDAAESSDIDSRRLNSSRSYVKQINVEILGESMDHNNGQYLKETTILSSKPAEPCDKNNNEKEILITKQEVTSIKPGKVSKLRASTTARLSTRHKGTYTTDKPTQILLTTTTTTVGKKSVFSKYLAPFQAGLRLSDSGKKYSNQDCSDDNTLIEERSVVDVQKNFNIKELFINNTTPSTRYFDVDTKNIKQPVFAEKPIDRIVKQPVFIENPVLRFIKQPTIEENQEERKQPVVENSVPLVIDRIVEKPIHHIVDRPIKVENNVPVDKIVKTPVVVEKIITKELKIPYHVAHILDRPVTVEKIVEKPVEVPHYIDRPVESSPERPVAVETTVETNIEKIINRPIPIQHVIEKHVQVPVPVTLEKVVEKIIDRPVPYTVEQIIDRPYPVEKIVEKIVDRPYPVQVPVEIPVHYPVQVPVAIPVPYPVEKYITLPLHEPKPTHSIIKTIHYEHLDLGMFLAQKKKYLVDHFFPKSHHYPKIDCVKPGEMHSFYPNNRYPVNDLHNAASSSIPVIVDNHHFNTQANNLHEKQPLEILNDDAYAGMFPIWNFASIQHEPVIKDYYIGPTPLLADHWAKSDVKFRRNPSYGKGHRIEYGGFKPPLVPSVEIDEHGIPL
ncbi:uncharacterized protein LOC5668386 isoform X1 [Anopheles gambiae]|uniref:uncharacterized protein LOC5668386 isoform X1 n=1 Tax=Anopheles gambiae TaxID=7165 RepID=UPI002AC94BA6|nr:uncharacterized protein LOC5668386 isoform X1 [Anopheles gambiae]XP_061514717.1 uncharacterized protein LOC5668386 isoform X1 [Anopheles gambiae]XP_061514718.1 uncharacterized protein LOC5668386 isoform X1 [Anopheles gambiae]XP_061514719.1 uncharacterized protein LOC5668386 isoform X1 [Anopheles gambiae]